MEKGRHDHARTDSHGTRRPGGHRAESAAYLRLLPTAERLDHRLARDAVGGAAVPARRLGATYRLWARRDGLPVCGTESARGAVHVRRGEGTQHRADSPDRPAPEAASGDDLPDAAHTAPQTD